MSIRSLLLTAFIGLLLALPISLILVLPTMGIAVNGTHITLAILGTMILEVIYFDRIRKRLDKQGWSGSQLNLVRGWLFFGQALVSVAVIFVALRMSYNVMVGTQIAFVGFALVAMAGAIATFAWIGKATNNSNN